MQQEDRGYSLYMHGLSQSGQLGIGFTNERVIDLPQKVDIRVHFVQITCGAGHSVALSDKGKVYSWGLNLLGQLGQGGIHPLWSPTLIQSLKDVNIVKVASGAGHSLAIDQSNTTYSWGASADFQTGIYVKPSGFSGMDTKQIITLPQRVEGLNCRKVQIVSISCGLKHTAVITFCPKT